MGYDGHLRVLDFETTTREVRKHGPKLVAVLGELSDPPDRLDWFRNDLAAAAESLDALATGASVDLTTVVEQMVTAGRRLGRRVVSAHVRLWTRTTGTAMSGLIPEAIAEHTERGGELWRKLVGATTRDWEYELTLGRETYSFERGTEGVLTSLLTSEEAEELHDELETVVPVATEVYDSIYPSSERQSIARSVRVVEGVYGLCWVATIFNSPIVYTMSV